MKNEKLENLEALRKLELASPKAIETLLELLQNSTPRIQLAAACKILEFAATNKPPRILPDEKPQTLDQQITFIENWSKNDETSPGIQPEYESEFYEKLASEA
jgi:HEAT repeat protein